MDGCRYGCVVDVRLPVLDDVLIPHLSGEGC